MTLNQIISKFEELGIDKNTELLISDDGITREIKKIRVVTDIEGDKHITVISLVLQ